MKGQQTLPRELRKRAERFFGVSFSGLEVSVDERVTALGARAFAFGPRIYLAPGCADFDRPEHLALLGHEMAHVVQQMEGRVPVTSFVAGLPLNDDPGLEAEADELGRRFAAGGPPRERSRCRSTPSAPVVQRTVISGGVLLRPPDPPQPLGEKIQLVLSLIPGGQEWLDWAIVEPRETFRFPNNAALVEGIQIGLHGSPLMLISSLGLLVSPKKLLALPEDVLAAVQKWQEDGEGSESQKKAFIRVLNGYEIYPQEDLQVVLKFLDEYQLLSKPVFQTISLMDQILMMQFIDADRGLQMDLLAEAAKFGVSKANNPREFIDYTELLLTVAADLGLSGSKKPTKAQKAKLWRTAEGVLAEMIPHLPGFLRGLSFVEAPSPGELEMELVQWIGSGQILGFQTLSSAANQVYQHADFSDENGKDVRKAIDEYMAEASTFLTSNRPDPGKMMQNGSTWFYKVEGEGGEAVLWLSVSGCLTLKSFVPASKRKPKTRHQRSSSEKGAQHDK